MNDALIPLQKDLYLVKGPFEGRFPEAFSYLVTGDAVAIIDTGFSDDVAEWLQATYRPQIVVNTHSHIDHCRQNHRFVDATTWAPAMSFDTFGGVQKLSERFVHEPEAAEEWRTTIRNDLLYRDCVPHRSFGDGHVFDFGSVRFTAVHAPGHTADHFCFWFEDTGTLLSVDIDLTRFGPWYGNPESDIALFRSSIGRVRALGPRRVSSSHRPPIDEDVDGELARFDARFDDNAERILALIERPRTKSELVEEKPIYRKFPYREKVLRYFEGMMIEKHLRILEAEGKVRSEGGRFVAVR